MVTSSSNLASHNTPPLSQLRAPRSISDNSVRRGRIIFLPRRHVRLNCRTSTSQRHRRRHQPISTLAHTLSTNSSKGSLENTIRPYEPTRTTSTNVPIVQSRTRLDCNINPRPVMSSNSGYVSDASSMTSKHRRRPVSPLHVPETNISTPPRRVSSSTLQDNAKRAEMHEYATPSRATDAHVFGGTSITRNNSNVNNALVEAISRNVAQQLHLLSIKHESPQVKHDRKKTAPPTSDSFENESRTPSQREALDRFTQELRQYAEQSGAKGKLPVFTPTPPQSGASLRTIAALLPFRSEFKAAGLAITSKDQKNTPFRASPLGRSRVGTTPALKSLLKQPHLVQVDSAARCPSSSTEIPFPAAHDMDEWRYAMVDNGESSRKRTTAGHEAHVTHCTSCQSGNLCHWSD